MRLGGVKLRIMVQRMSTTQDSFGQQVRSWDDVCPLMCSVNPVTGKNYYSASAERADVTHEIRALWTETAILPNDRLVNGSRIFRLKSPPINVGERNSELLLMCTEVIGTDED